MNAIEYPPYQRLHISNHAYKPAHVFNIARDLSKHHSVELPGYDSNDQTRWAYWITNKFGYNNQLIVDAHHRVQRSYNGREGIYRKGRKVGSKNRFSPRPEGYLDERPATDPLDDVLGGSTEATPPTETLTSEPATPPSLDLSAYALKTDLYRVSQAITDSLKPTYEQLSKEVQIQGSIIAGLHAKVNNIVDNRPTIVTLERRELPALELGVQHKHFPDLLAMCLSRVNVWLFGPAGTGKTTAAKIVAKTLGLQFYMQSAMETGFQVLGYCDAHGNYVTTLFRQCWEHGGVIILDEQDSYSPSATLALNGALANGFCAFADKIVPRHPDCIIIAGANTTGLGGTIEYSGRAKLDAAYLDRFVMLDWPIDLALEAHLCPNTAWLAIVRSVRASIVAKQIKGAMATPRASIYGSMMLAQGVSLDRAMRSTLRKGMTDAQWDMVQPSNDLLTACA